MRDRHRPAALDLPAEDRDHAAGRAEDVAEADRDEARRDVLARAVRLDDPLAERLDWPVDVLRVRGLVGRDRARTASPRTRPRRRRSPASRARCSAPPRRGFASISGTCLYAAAWKTTPGVYRSKTWRIFARFADVGEHRERRREVALADELALDLEQRRLRRGRRARAAPAPRRAIWRQSSDADRPARAGDEHGLAREVRRRPRRGRPRPARGRARPRPGPGGSGRRGRGRRRSARRGRAAS